MRTISRARRGYGARPLVSEDSGLFLLSTDLEAWLARLADAACALYSLGYQIFAVKAYTMYDVIVKKKGRTRVE